MIFKFSFPIFRKRLILLSFYQEKELEQARTEHSRLERMKAEMARQEVQWKEAYDVLFAENESLKSSGSEALLASQWRQRFEACLREKEECENKLKLYQLSSRFSAFPGAFVVWDGEFLATSTVDSASRSRTAVPYFFASFEANFRSPS